MLSKANYNLLSEYRSETLPFPTENTERIQSLISDGFLSIENRNSRLVDKGIITYVDSDQFLHITPEGEDALAAYEEMLYEKAENKRDKVNDRRLQIILALFSFASGLIVEYLTGIVGFVSGLFQ